MQRSSCLGVVRPLVSLVLTFILLVQTGAPVLYAKEWDDSQKVYYLLNDHLGNIDKVLDEEGNVVEEYDYLPYGQERVHNDPNGKDETDYGYAGKELDIETELYYFGGRFFDPKIGRFITVDPLVFTEARSQYPTSFKHNILADPQIQNSYSYARNNPLAYKDPNGESPIMIFPDPTQIPGFRFGAPYQEQQLTSFEKQIAITIGTLASGVSISYELRNIFSGISALYNFAQESGQKLQQSGIVEMSPNELIPTEQANRGKTDALKRKMKESNQFYSSHPVRYYEDEGKKYIVDGHHRTEAARELGMNVKAKSVDESYLQKVWNTTKDKFLDKAKNYLNEIKTNAKR